jgi:hypothetical protein
MRHLLGKYKKLQSMNGGPYLNNMDKISHFSLLNRKVINTMPYPVKVNWVIVTLFRLLRLYIITSKKKILKSNSPKTVKSLFIEHKKDISCVKINFDGQWTVVWVDHYFPFNKKTNRPAFCK